MNPVQIGAKLNRRNMEHIKILCQKTWLDYNHYIIGAAIGFILGAIIL